MSTALGVPLLTLRAKSVFQNEIYWNDWSQLSIFRASKTSGSRMEILVGRLNGIMDMKIFYRGKTTGNCADDPPWDLEIVHPPFTQWLTGPPWPAFLAYPFLQGLRPSGMSFMRGIFCFWLPGEMIPRERAHRTLGCGGTSQFISQIRAFPSKCCIDQKPQDFTAAPTLSSFNHLSAL